ncbi:hypothetical protein Efla_007458 [Eimeria flavescens]
MMLIRKGLLRRMLLSSPNPGAPMLKEGPLGAPLQKPPPGGTPQRPAGFRAPDAGGSVQQCCCPHSQSLAEACEAYCVTRRSRKELSPSVLSLSPAAGVKGGSPALRGGGGGAPAEAAAGAFPPWGAPREGFAAALLRAQAEAVYSSNRRLPVGKAGEGINGHHSNDFCCGIKQTPDDLEAAKKCIYQRPPSPLEGTRSGPSGEGAPNQDRGPPGRTFDVVQQTRKEEKASLAALFAARLTLCPHLSLRARGPPAWWWGGGAPLEGPPEGPTRKANRGRGVPHGLPQDFCFGASGPKDTNTVAQCMQHTQHQQQQQQQQQQQKQPGEEEQQVRQRATSQNEDHLWDLLHPPSRWEALIRGDVCCAGPTRGPQKGPREGSRGAPRVMREQLWQLVSAPTPLLSKEQFNAAFAAALQQQEQQQQQQQGQQKQQERQEEEDAVGLPFFLSAFNAAVAAQAARDAGPLLASL